MSFLFRCLSACRICGLQVKVQASSLEQPLFQRRQAVHSRQQPAARLIELVRGYSSLARAPRVPKYAAELAPALHGIVTRLGYFPLAREPASIWVALHGGAFWQQSTACALREGAQATNLKSVATITHILAHHDCENSKSTTTTREKVRLSERWRNARDGAIKPSCKAPAFATGCPNQNQSGRFGFQLNPVVKPQLSLRAVANRNQSGKPKRALWFTSENEFRYGK